MAECTFEGCDKPRTHKTARGLCEGHHGQVRRGTPLRPLRERRGGTTVGSGGQVPDVPPEERTALMAEDCEWLREGGLHPLWWPGRVGAASVSALEKRLRKHGYSTLAQALQPYING